MRLYIFSEEEDLIHQIHAVYDAVTNNTSFSVLDSPIRKHYVEGLKPRHRPTSHHRRLHILDCTFEATKNEVSNIIESRAAGVGKSFITFNSDFFGFLSSKIHTDV